jgi:hypothetical protein
MKHGLFLIASAAMIAGCNKQPEVNAKNASVGEVAEQVREATGGGSFIQPGRWESKMTLLDVDVPGMPAQVAQQMKQSMSAMQEKVMTTCLTDADVKKPKEDFFAGNAKGCRYDHFTMSGGKIDAVMSCKAEGGGGSMTMAINGTYAPDSYSATTVMKVTDPGEGHGMNMKSQMESHRVGQCKGDEINASKEREG